MTSRVRAFHAMIHILSNRVSAIAMAHVRVPAPRRIHPAVISSLARQDKRNIERFYSDRFSVSAITILVFVVGTALLLLALILTD